MPWPSLPSPEPGTNPIFAIILDPKPFVCLSKEPTPLVSSARTFRLDSGLTLLGSDLTLMGSVLALIASASLSNSTPSPRHLGRWMACIGFTIPWPSLPRPVPSMNPIFAIIFEPKPLVCISKEPSWVELLSAAFFPHEVSPPIESTAIVSVTDSAMVPRETKDTGRSANEICFLEDDFFPLDSRCFANFPGAERPFHPAGPLKFSQLTEKPSGSVPKSFQVEFGHRQMARKTVQLMSH